MASVNKTDYRGSKNSLILSVETLPLKQTQQIRGGNREFEGLRKRGRGIRERRLDLLRRVGSQGGGDPETIRVGYGAIDVAKILERPVDFFVGNGVTPVFEHFKDGPPSKVVAVALDCAVVNEATQTSLHCLSVHFSVDFHTRSLSLSLSLSTELAFGAITEALTRVGTWDLRNGEDGRGKMAYEKSGVACYEKTVMRCNI